MVFNVNTNASIILTAKLERLNKSAFPSAVRSTLSDMAFIMKKQNILNSAKKNMKVKNPIFFKKFTGVNRATGFNVNTMFSEVGFKNTDPNPIKGKKAIQGMEHNEVGGKDSTGAMYMKPTRNTRGLVKRTSRFNKGKVLRLGKGSNSKDKYSSRFIANAYASLEQKKAFFLYTKTKGKFLVSVKSIDKGNGKPDVKLNFLMRSRRKNIAVAKATFFNKEAALLTHKSVDDFYTANANYQFAKALK